MRKTSLALSISLFMLLCATTFSVPAHAQCLSVTTDLSYGMSDSSSNGPVTLFQRYLASKNYLSVPATGYFGQATLMATKALQAANGLPSTGYAGALTRAAINRASCVSSGTSVTPSTVTPVASAPIAVTPGAVTPSSASSGQSSVITAPLGGQSLTIGQSFLITWNTQPYSRYNIVLVPSSGIGGGFIAWNVGGVNSYQWTVGNVISSQTQANAIVNPGTYQVRIENVATGAEPTDPISSPFNVSNATLNIGSIFPASAVADGNTAVVLYGSGFNASTWVNLGASNTRGQVLYVSPDGKVLVFSVPVGTAAGAQSVSVSNSTGVASNQLPFNIISQ